MKYLVFVILFSISFLQISSQTFTEVSLDIGIGIVQKDAILTGGGCAFFDYDNDGHEDIFITGGRVSDGLYHNNGDGTFTNEIINSGLEKPDSLVSNGVCVGDINNDGCKDVFIGMIKNDMNGDIVPSTNQLYINNCDGTFTDITVSAGISNFDSWGIGATMGDVNMDGLLDIYAINYIVEAIVSENPDGSGDVVFEHVPEANELFINNGDNTFTEMSATYGVDDFGCSLAAAFSDYDFDHDVDLLVVNDFGQFVEPSSLYTNDFPNNSFIDNGNTSNFNQQFYGMGIAVGDYDEDGDLDYYECNWGRNVLHENQGDGTFVDKSTETGTENTWILINNTTTVSWATFFGDFDNDADLDLFVANGFMPGASPVPVSAIDNYDAFYQNQGDGTFLNFANVLGINNEWPTRGAAMGDYDSDGDLDYIAVVIDEFVENFDTVGNPIRTLVFRNDTDEGYNWVGFQLQGTDIIRDAYGSRVEVYADGRKFIREVDGGSSHASHNSSRIHVGLGNITEVDSVRFIWLGGDTEVLWEPDINQYHHIIQGELIDPVSISDLKNDYDFNVFPTIVEDEINVKLNIDESRMASFFIYDNRGLLIRDFGEVQLNQGENILAFNSLKDLPHGVYYLKLNIGGKVMARKFVK